MLDAAAQQIADSTSILDTTATQDTVRLVRTGVKRLTPKVRTSGIRTPTS